jgi:hypothetical protein
VSYGDARVTCAGCEESVPDNRWSKIRASAAGWFFQKDGTAYCPLHVPAWVAGWRRSRGPSTL